MKRYAIRFAPRGLPSDQRVWEVVVKADGIADRGGLIVFWRRWGPFGWMRYDAHYIQIDMLISVIGDAGND